MKLDEDEIRKDWERATKGLAAWRTETRESYDFAASHQWAADDVSKLEEEERPVVTFDRIGVFVDAVSGLEINNRQAIKYFPVEQGDVKVNDVLSQSVKYFENDCGAEDEDSEAARDAVICGVGCTETILSTDKNPDGAPTVIRRDPLNTWYDPDASRRNLEDRRFQFYGDWIPLEEAKERWGDEMFSGEPPENNRTEHVADRAFEYKENATEDTREGQVFVLHYQCWKRVPLIRLKDPQSGQTLELTSSKFKAAKEMFLAQYGREPVEATASNGAQGDYVRQTKKVYYRAFLSGGKILEQDKLPTDAFTFNFITYKRDRNKRCWYGLVRVAKDPQRWANKWVSNTIHILNTNAKGGAYAETGAFADPKMAEEQWAQANPLILLKEGGIEKIKDREQAQFPAGMDRMMQFCFNIMPMVTGLNLETLGLADREQAGVLEAQRRQSAFTLLAPFFAAIREYRKSRGRLMLKFLKFIPQGTLVKIVGPTGEQWVPLAYQDTTYDVKVDQAPDSPDYKKTVWEALGVIIPPMMKAGYPIPPEILTYSPLPTDVSEQWVRWIKEQGWMPPEQQEQMKQMWDQVQKLGSENMQLKEQNATLRVDSAVDMLKLQQKAAGDREKNAVKEAAISSESFNRQLEITVNAALKRFEMGIDASIDRAKLILEAQKLVTEERNRADEKAEKKKEEKKEKQEKEKPINISLTIPEKKPKKLKVKRTADGFEVDG